MNKAGLLNRRTRGKTPLVMAVLLLAAFLPQGCSKFNVKYEKLERDRPLMVKEAIPDEVYQFMDDHKKLVALLQDLDQFLWWDSAPPSMGRAQENLEYIDLYVNQAETSYLALIDYGMDHEDDVMELLEEEGELKEGEQAAFEFYLKTAAVHKKGIYTDYLDSVRVFVNAAREKARFLNDNYDVMILGLSYDKERFQQLHNTYMESRKVLNALVEKMQEAAGTVDWKPPEEE